MSDNWFYGTSSHEYYNNILHTTNITARNLETSSHARGTVQEGNLLSSVMIELTITQEAVLPIETFNGTQSKFEAWTESIENAVQTSGKNATYIAFSKLTGSALLTANRLKAGSPNLMWMELKRELSIQYSVILSDNHAT